MSIELYFLKIFQQFTHRIPLQHAFLIRSDMFKEIKLNSKAFTVTFIRKITSSRFGTCYDIQWSFDDWSAITRSFFRMRHYKCTVTQLLNGAIDGISASNRTPNNIWQDICRNKMSPFVRYLNRSSYLKISNSTSVTASHKLGTQALIRT